MEPQEGGKLGLPGGLVESLGSRGREGTNPCRWSACFRPGDQTGELELEDRKKREGKWRLPSNSQVGVTSWTSSLVPLGTDTCYNWKGDRGRLWPFGICGREGGTWSFLSFFSFYLLLIVYSLKYQFEFSARNTHISLESATRHSSVPLLMFGLFELSRFLLLMMSAFSGKDTFCRLYRPALLWKDIPCEWLEGFVVSGTHS